MLSKVGIRPTYCLRRGGRQVTDIQGLFPAAPTGAASDMTAAITFSRRGKSAELHGLCQPELRTGGEVWVLCANYRGGTSHQYKVHVVAIGQVNVRETGFTILEVVTLAIADMREIGTDTRPVIS